MTTHDSWTLPRINAARCTGCGECERLCPTGAVVIMLGLAVIVHPESCNFCEVCEAICPQEAIERPFTVIFGPETHLHSLTGSSEQ